MCQQLTATVHIFLKVPTASFLVFFSKHISRTAALLQASVLFVNKIFRALVGLVLHV